MRPVLPRPEYPECLKYPEYPECPKRPESCGSRETLAKR